MKIIKTFDEWLEIEKEIDLFSKNLSVGLVPTMGALHEGHLSLVNRCVCENSIRVVSIFVNPTQFDNSCDLAAYPKQFDEDYAMLEKFGIQYVFAPDYEDLYPDEFKYRIYENDFSKILCGASRPGHFTGVLTVVMKLLQIFQPTRAYFGEKDYQQLCLVRGLAEAFFLRTQIVSCPIVRAESGLALSSRNARLSESGKEKASFLYKVLTSGKDEKNIRSELESYGFNVDYVLKKNGRLYAAVFIEGVRLIDNVEC